MRITIIRTIAGAIQNSSPRNFHPPRNCYDPLFHSLSTIKFTFRDIVKYSKPIRLIRNPLQSTWNGSKSHCARLHFDSLTGSRPGSNCTQVKAGLRIKIMGHYTHYSGLFSRAERLRPWNPAISTPHRGYHSASALNSINNHSSSAD